MQLSCRAVIQWSHHVSSGRHVAWSRFADLVASTKRLLRPWESSSLALKLAGRNDYGAARSVAQDGVQILAEQIEAARLTRRRAFVVRSRMPRRSERRRWNLPGGIDIAAAEQRFRDDELVPVIPSLRSTLKVILGEWLGKDAELYDVPEFMTAALLRSSGRAEAAAPIVATPSLVAPTRSQFNQWLLEKW